MYEILTINGGVEHILLVTENVKQVKQAYRRTINPRIRVDGRIMPICEADAFAEGMSVFFKPFLETASEKSSKRGNRRAVEKIDAKGNVVARYPSVECATRANWYESPNTVRRSCKNHRMTKDGSRFRYADEEFQEDTDMRREDKCRNL